jgi:hypothetical protein
MDAQRQETIESREKFREFLFCEMRLARIDWSVKQCRDFTDRIVNSLPNSSASRRLFLEAYDEARVVIKENARRVECLRRRFIRNN